MAGVGAALSRANAALASALGLSNRLVSGASGADGASFIASNDTVGGTLWSNIAGFMAALLAGTVASSDPTRAQMVANHVPAVVTTITTSGFTTAGDGGGATYVRAAGPFTDGSSFQSADGQWWQYAQGQDIYAAQFGVLADGFSFSTGTISSGALNKLVLPASAWKRSAATVGNPITIIGGAPGAQGTYGSGILVTTIAAVSGNTITLAAPVAAAMTNVCGTFGTDNSVAINKIIAYATSLVEASAAKSLQATDVLVRWPYGIICYASALSFPDYVSGFGWGSRCCQLFAMSSTANVSTTVSGYAPAGSSYGGRWQGMSIHGNNLVNVAGGLFNCANVGTTFDDFRVWWSLGDGWVMNYAQNCPLINCSLTNNGNPNSVISTFTVSGLTVTPLAGSVYTHNNHSYYVHSAAIAGGAGTIVCISTGPALASGTLTKGLGTGDAAIAFSAVAGGSTPNSSLRFTNNACGNTVIRSENSTSAGYGILFGGQANGNTVFHGEVEQFKGQYTSEYYPTALTISTLVAAWVSDGFEGLTPYGNYDNRMVTAQTSLYNATARAAPHIILRNNGLLIADGTECQGNTTSSIWCQFGPDVAGNTSPSKLFVQSVCDVDGNYTVFYDANSVAGLGYVDLLGELFVYQNNYTTLYNPGIQTNTATNVITNVKLARINLVSGQITYPATQNPSTNPYTHDDYREDLPTSAASLAVGGSSTGITYSAGPYHNYVKDGQIVTGYIRMTVTSIAALTGNITINGLPFPASANQTIVGSGDFPSLSGVALGTGNQLIASVASGSQALTVNLSGAAGTSPATAAILSLPTAFVVHYRYRAAQ